MEDLDDDARVADDVLNFAVDSYTSSAYGHVALFGGPERTCRIDSVTT